MASIYNRVKIALISEVLPPAPTGQAVIIGRLLQSMELQNYCLISRYKWHDEQAGPTYSGNLPGRHYQLTSHFLLDRGHRLRTNKVGRAVDIPLSVLFRSRQIYAIVARENCNAIVACTGDLLDLPAGYLASRRAGVPFYAYIFDHYTYREWSDPVKQFWARRFEPVLMRGAARVIAPNEVLGDELRRKYGIDPLVIGNSLDLTPYEALGGEAPANGDGKIKIVYTGDIYEAHYDAFRNLLAAIERLGRAEVELHLYTPRSPDELAAQNIRGPIVWHQHHAPSEMPRIQRQATLLFLPLAFSSPYPDLVRTSATTKLGEYLAARRPVLVHAPPDSFVAWYFRKHQCGVVADQCDPALLCQSIETVLGNSELQQQLGERAWERARADFNITTAQTEFLKLLRRGVNNFKVK